MTAPRKSAIRCAIYTRKSSEEGLDQAFNSLHAQREACESYVKSQAGEGWKTLPALYDDGGFSGGNLERPALKQLLADIDAGRVDTVVVYKVDRLTRSLTDFAKIVERLDAAGVSFVSVTQAFNTTSSMGRLTLNVLLSFAQFEREVTGERIRDKIAASKAKGMWMGGTLPLGYDCPTDLTSRALVVNLQEADEVRLLFQTYLELGSVSALQAFLEQAGIRSKSRVSNSGRQIGGVPFSRGALFHLLKNRTYLGEIIHRDRSYPGAHPAIVDSVIFDAVQAQLSAQRRERRDKPPKLAAMALKGLVFNADGEPMSPTFAYGQAGRTYRYYVSAPLQQSRKTKPNPAAIHRVSAPAIEDMLRQQLVGHLELDADTPLAALVQVLSRIDIEAESVTITLRKTKVARSRWTSFTSNPEDDRLLLLTLPIRCRLRGGRTWITPPPGAAISSAPRRDPALIRGLRQAHQLAAAIGWKANGDLGEGSGAAPANPYERRLCRLAFLAPDIQAAIIQGRQPVELNLERLTREALPMEWETQRRRFGFAG